MSVDQSGLRYDETFAGADVPEAWYPRRWRATDLVDSQRAQPTLGGKRPRRLPWPVGLVVLAGMALVASVGALVGFLVAGATSGPVDWGELFRSPTWDPAHGAYGALAMIFGTVAASAIALAVAVPVGRCAAVALNELLPRRLRRPVRTATELLAAVPSIVYGLVGIVVLRPLVSRVFDVPGGDSLVAAGLILAVMVLPTVVSVSVDALAAVPPSSRHAAAALGLTRREVIRGVVVPSARPGLRSAALLGLARALGETIAVFLVVGRADGRLPSPAGALSALVRPGQTITTKIGGPEWVLAGNRGPQHAALSALALLLLAAVAVGTLASLALGRRRPATLRVPVRSASRWRSARERAMVVRGALALSLPVALVAGVLAMLVTRGSHALHPSFWTSPAAGAAGGGVRDQILGTLLLVAAAGLMAAPVGLGIGLLTSHYGGRRLSRLLRTATVTLGGVPSVVVGVAGYALFSSYLGWGKSWLAGAFALAVIVTPVVALTTAARIDALPAEQREAALALGLSGTAVVRSVLVPYARPGLLTGLLLGLARAAGETAPILFTATVFTGVSGLPHGVVQAPVLALPTHIFTLAQDAADPAAISDAWGSALVLVVLAGLLLVAAAPFRRRIEESR